MKLLALVLSLGIYAQAQTAEQLMSGSQNVTPGCVVSVPGHWSDTKLISGGDPWFPPKELGGFTVTVSDIACRIHDVGPERLVFSMPYDAPLGDYSAMVNTPTGMKSVAMHVVEAAPAFSVDQFGRSGLLTPLHFPFPAIYIGPDGVINLPQDGDPVRLILFASGLNPGASLEREVRFTRIGSRRSYSFPVLWASNWSYLGVLEHVTLFLKPIPAADYQIVLRVGSEFSEPKNVTIQANGPVLREPWRLGFRPPWLSLPGEAQ